MYQPNIKDDVKMLLVKLYANDSKEFSKRYKDWTLSVIKTNEVIDVYFRDKLLVEYNLLNNILYTRGNKYEYGIRCWYKWEKQAKSAVCTYFHIKPQNILLTELKSQVIYFNSNAYARCSCCGHNVSIINYRDEYCRHCHKQLIY